MSRDAGKDTRPEETEAAAAPATVGEAFDYGRFMMQNGANAHAFSEASEAFFKGMVAINQEMARFAGQRLHDNMARNQSIVSCDDWLKAYQIQTDFARAATEQYFSEATRLLDMAATVAKQSWAPLEERTRDALDEINTQQKT